MNYRRTYRRGDGPLSPSKVSFLRTSLNQQYHVAMDRMEGRSVTRRVNLNSESFKPIHSGLYITGRGMPQRMERETRRRERQYDAPAAESGARLYDVDRYESPMDDPRSRSYESPVDDPRRRRYESPDEDPRRRRYESPMDDPRSRRYESPVDDPHSRRYESPDEEPRSRRYESPGTGVRREDRTAEFQERLQRFREKADRIMAENMDASKDEEPEPQRRVHFANIEPQEEEESFHEVPVPRNEVEPVFEEEEEDENKGLDFYQMFEKFKARTEAMLGEGACAKQDTAAKAAPPPKPDHEEFEVTQEEEEEAEPPQQIRREVKAPPVNRREDPPKVDRGDDLSNRISDRLEAFKRRAAQAIEVDDVSVEEDLEDGQFGAIEEEEEIGDFDDVEDDQY